MGDLEEIYGEDRSEGKGKELGEVTVPVNCCENEWEGRKVG